MRGVRRDRGDDNGVNECRAPSDLVADLLAAGQDRPPTPRNSLEVDVISDSGRGSGPAFGQIRLARAFLGLSLKAVAKEAGISAAYLQKLETGKVKSPSPHRLLRLAEVLGYPYSTLLAWAGYPCPEPSGQRNGTTTGKRARKSDVLIDAIGSGELGPDEAEWLACSLRGYREARSVGVQIPAEFLSTALKMYRQTRVSGGDLRIEDHAGIASSGNRPSRAAAPDRV